MSVQPSESAAIPEEKSHPHHQEVTFRFERILWVLIAILTIGLYAAALPSHWAQLSEHGTDWEMSLGQLGVSINFYAIYILGIQAITIFCFAVMALIIFFSKSSNRMTLLVSLGLLTIGTAVFPTLNIFANSHPEWRIPVLIVQSIGLGSMLLVFYLFPDGRFVPKWTRPLAFIWIVWVLFWAVSPTSLSMNVENWPVVIQTFSQFLMRTDSHRISHLYNNIRLYSLGAVLSIWVGSGVFAQIYRYKHASTIDQRQQTKWVVLGLSTAAIGYFLVYLIFGPTTATHHGTMGIIFNLASNTLTSVCLLIVPLAIGSSILRFRIWEVDFLINQSLVYGALTLFTSLFYLANVFLLQAIFRAVTGRSSDAAIVITTLIIALMIQPLRKRMQSFIDKMFFREKVDFRQVFTDFSLEIRTIIELPELLNVLISQVTDLLHSKHGAVYLFTEEKKFKLAKSVNLESTEAIQLPLDASALQRLQNSTAVVNENHPVFQILVPLMAPRAEDQFIGILALGPRLSGQSYAREDRALLYTLTDQAGTAIHVAQLIQEKQAEIQRREEAERSLELYHNSPAGRAEALATVIKEYPRFALGGLYQIAQHAGSDPQIASILDNFPQAFERQDEEILANLSRAIAYIFTSQWTPDLLLVGLRGMTETLANHQDEFFNGRQVMAIYHLFQRAIEANSIPQIIEIGEDPDWACAVEESAPPKIPDKILANLPPELIPEENADASMTGLQAIQAIPPLIEALRAYQRVDTSRDKLAYLASAVERLRHIEFKARTSPASPERPIVMQISESWMAVITSAMTEIQTRAQIVCQLLTRNTWRNDVITLVLGVRNEGRGAALNVQVTLAPAPEYTLINASDTIPRLAPGEEIQVQLRIRPRIEQEIDQIRARFVIMFTDPRGPDQIENFADVVHLLATTGDFEFIPNPYVVGTPLRTGSPLFFGREEVITYIQENLAASHRNNLVLIGQRRTGKTSLLKQLPAHLGDEYIPVYLDGQSLGLDPGLSNFFLNIATEISFVLEDRGFQIDLPNPEDFADSPATIFEKGFLQQVRAIIGDRHLLILLDEFEELESAIQRGNLDSSVLSFLRHLIQHTPNLSVIFCGTHRIEELASDYWSVLFNISLYRSIGFLEKDEAFHLIQEPVREFGMRYDDLALDKIWRVTAGHPYFLQLLCHSLVNWHNKTERNYVTIADVNAALDEILASGEAHFVYLWTEANPAERLVLTTLSRMIPLSGHASAVQVGDYLEERGVTIELRTIQKALHRLSLREILSSHEDLETRLDEVYHWKLGLLGMWVEKYQSMTRVMDEFNVTE